MSTTIDSKVVEMRFDNKNFEKNVQTSLSTLDKLKQSLNMQGAAKGLESVDRAAKNVNMTGLGNAVESVQAKFSAMQVMAVTALANITNSAVNAGRRIVSALTIDPIRSGFQEYETQMGAIQTILANTQSKGTTLTDVTGALDELNTYADQTIYNFTEMTRNIGTFTAAGVDLDRSVSSIKGIANLAAVSGSTSQQASTAMYQLSQALAAGRVSLMDWNSVVNAGMGGQLFQDALKRTAEHMGTNVDALIKKYGSFRESLTQGEWLTAEVLTETLTQLSGAYTEADLISQGYTEQQAKDIVALAKTAVSAATEVKTLTQLWDTLKESAQSGWSQTWEIIVGDFEEAKALFTNISNVVGGMIGKSAEVRNELLQGWKDAGGRADLIEGFANIFEGIMSVVKPIGNAFKAIFPSITVENLLAFTEGFKNLTERLKLGFKASVNLNKTFRGLFAVIDILRQAFGAALKIVKPLFNIFVDLGGGILGFTAKIGDALVKFNEFLKSGDAFNKVAEGIATAIEFIHSKVKEFISIIREKFAPPGLEIFHAILERIHARIVDIVEAASGLKSGFVAAFDAMGSAAGGNGFLNMMASLWDGVQKLGVGLTKAFGFLTGGLAEKIGNADFSGIFDFINTLSISGIAVFVAKFIKGFSDIADSVGSFKESAIGILDEVRGCFEAYQTQLKAGALIKIASAIAILAGAILVISLIDSKKLSASLGAITVLFADLMGAMAIFTKFSGDMKGAVKSTTMMIGMSVALLIMASALKKLGSLDIKELGVGLAGVLGLTAIVVGALKLLARDDDAVVKGATQMVIMAAALKILASVCKDLSYFSWEELAKGGAGILGFTAIMVGAAKVLSSGDGSMIKGATQMVIMAAALKILANVCKDFSSMNWEDLARGLTGMVVALGAMVAALRLMPTNTKVWTDGFMGSSKTNMISAGIGMIAMAAAMKIFASAAKDMASMDWVTLARGLTGMVVALGAVTLALRLMPSNMVTMGVGLIAVSAALEILADVLIKMGGMGWIEIAKGLVTIGISLTMLSNGLYAMTGTMSGAAALLVAAAALAVLTPVLSILGAMSWESIAKGLIALAGAFAIIGIAGWALTPLVPTLLSLAGAIALIGLSVVAFGAGLTLVGVGLSAIGVGIGALATAVAGGATAIVSAVVAIAAGLIGLIPMVIEKLGEGVIAFAGVIAREAPAIGEAFKAVVLTLVDVLVECVPAIANGALALVAGVLAALVEYTPKIVDFLFQFLIGVIEGLGRNIPKLTQAFVDMIMSIMSGVIDALKTVDIDILLKGLMGVGLMAGLMAALAAVAALTPMAMVGVLGMGAVITELALVLAAIGTIAQIPGLDWLISEGGKFLQTVGTAIGQFIGGIVGGFMGGVSSQFPQIGSDLSAFMTNAKPFIEGAKTIDASVISGIEALADMILTLTAVDILDGLTSWITGGSSLATFGAELAAFGPSIKAYSDSVKGIDSAAVEASVSAAQMLSALADNLPNSGGVVGWFMGENDIAVFGQQLVPFGAGMKAYSDAISGFNPEAVIASANAAKALADMSNHIPNQGGLIAWFTGDNSIAKFGNELVMLGHGLKAYSLIITGFNAEAVIASANAAKVLADMTSTIPNEGGVSAWFAGENSISKFGNELVALAHGLKAYSVIITGFNAEAVIASANAAKVLADMTSIIPNEGGVAAWFAGENSISKFGDDIVALGYGLKGFSVAITGINIENMTAAASAAKALAQMCSYIPNEGGIVSWFTGENSIAKFGLELATLGAGMKSFSDNVTGINPETVTAAASAAKSLAQMVSYIPNEGGVVAWFTGENSLATFADRLPALGDGLKSFSTSVEGINAENVTAAANAAKALAEMANVVPNEGGFKQWLTGENSLATFADRLPALGDGLKGFSDSVEGINPENVKAAASAAKSLAEMASTTPKNTDKVAKFGENLVSFGKKLKSFFDETNTITSEKASSISGVIKSISDAVSGLKAGTISSASKAIDKLVETLENMSSITEKTTDGFVKALKKLGEVSVDALIKAFDDAGPKLEKAGKSAMEKLIDGIESKEEAVNTAAKNAVKNAATAAKEAESKFNSAGAYLVRGFARGITETTFVAEARARAMAKAAARAAEKALDINSPSRVGYGIGRFFGLGFVNAIGDFADKAYQASTEMAASARTGLSNTISKISSFINSDMDMQPTIRPVLDLSDIRSGVGEIGNILDIGSSVSVLSNLGSINTMMNRRNQNGSNDDVVSAINRLRNDLGNVGNTTYNVNGITYDDGSNISDAVKTIARYMKLEGRI